jgi:hypothetical protein
MPLSSQAIIMPKNSIQPIQVGYIVFALLMYITMVILVPREKIRKLFWFSLLWGPTVDISLVWIFSALHLYKYQYLKPFDFLGAPIWNALAWIPAIVLFLYFLPDRKERYVIWLYIATFSMVGVFVGAYYTEFGLVQDIHFHYVLRFPVWYLWFLAVLWHYRKLYAGDEGSTEKWH